ncbi:FAD-dependent oxidoreductase [Rhodobacteraceae bacterium SC52]|nr:FAD-dependent oxidoreductase [Rhodobacteraceae bacterium SC52]
MVQPDVTIRGAGIFGLAVAHACAGQGARVRVVDPNGIGAGSSGGIVGALAPHTPENWNAKKAFQFESLRLAEAWWANVTKVSGLSAGYARLGRLQPLADERAVVLARSRADNAATLWQSFAHWTLLQSSEAGDWAPHSPSGWLVRDTLTARLHPAQACRALAASVVAQGGEIVTEADRVGPEVWATGYEGLAHLSVDLGRSVGAGVKGQAILLDLDRRGEPQLFADGLHIVPHQDGTVAIGSTSERDFTDPTSTDAQLDDILARAIAACPAVADAPVLARWAGVRPRARTRSPMLGKHPLQDGVFIANGGFKIGFGMAPKVAEVMADLILRGQGEIPPGFRVEDNI